MQEEFDVAHLDKEDFLSVYRTTMGHAASAYSRDGGHTWTRPEPLRYRPGGRMVKQPRACNKIWKTPNGRYVLWFHDNGTTTYNNGFNSGSRNLAWLCAGRLKDGQVWWSEPELVAYVNGGLEGCSYPDLIEEGGMDVGKQAELADLTDGNCERGGDGVFRPVFRGEAFYLSLIHI